MTRFAVICASNQNRSMEAHNVLQKAGFNVSSYGTGTAVRLPGPSANQPNIYEFGRPYDEIYRDLQSKDPKLYEKNGLLRMLDRNRRIKLAPERFQESRDTYDVLITCEERCFDSVLQELLQRGGDSNLPVHVINVEIVDNHDAASKGGKLICELAEHIQKAGFGLDEQMGEILRGFEQAHGTLLLHTISYY
ncbi:MAG: RNA polymerase II subunit A [Piptocephalis tieghemiana]|nr:MAG: RNA polymerase II subunit A [Piptocephalis tieghemiana]